LDGRVKQLYPIPFDVQTQRVFFFCRSSHVTGVENVLRLSRWKMRAEGGVRCHAIRMLPA
jgi:hypothetical protein